MNEMSGNYAMVDGKKYHLKFEGYDRATYQHRNGCLHKADSRMPCQCGAIDRATMVYGVYVTGEDRAASIQSDTAHVEGDKQGGGEA